MRVLVLCQYHNWLFLELWQFFYKGLTRNQEIENTSVCVLPYIWRLEGVRDAKFGSNVSNEILLNAAKYQGYSFYRFWVINGKATGRQVKLPPSPRLGLSNYNVLLLVHQFLLKFFHLIHFSLIQSLLFSFRQWPI